MRLRKFILATALALFSSAALAQQTPGTTGGSMGSPPATTPSATVPTAGRAPPVGSQLLPGTATGLDKVADDGISTKNVKAVRCSTAARETDGTTTCIGIPDESPRTRKKR